MNSGPSSPPHRHGLGNFSDPVFGFLICVVGLFVQVSTEPFARCESAFGLATPFANMAALVRALLLLLFAVLALGSGTDSTKKPDCLPLSELCLCRSASDRLQYLAIL